ncbi:hypothetical protein [Streptomyces platensis]|uniref:hypothetical protein n=1 Tax=Streptomyces platensis TaxID=58346 RepID=UPI002E269722
MRGPHGLARHRRRGHRPAVRVTVLLPSLASAAKAATDAPHSMRNATDRAALDTARARANNAAEGLVTAAGEPLSAA